MVLESFSDCDDDEFKSTEDKSKESEELARAISNSVQNTEENESEIRRLLRRKDELERRHTQQEEHHKKLQVIYSNIPL